MRYVIAATVARISKIAGHAAQIFLDMLVSSFARFHYTPFLSNHFPMSCKTLLFCDGLIQWMSILRFQ